MGIDTRHQFTSQNAYYARCQRCRAGFRAAVQGARCFSDEELAWRRQVAFAALVSKRKAAEKANQEWLETMEELP